MTRAFTIILLLSAMGAVVLAQQTEEQQEKQTQPSSDWQYGGFIDLAYPLNFNHPANHLFRSRGTGFRTDSVWLNMAALYARKKATEDSRWGIELTAQAGKDDEFFGFSATAPNIAGNKFLRHLGPTNVSYLAPVRSEEHTSELQSRFGISYA